MSYAVYVNEGVLEQDTPPGTPARPSRVPSFYPQPPNHPSVAERIAKMVKKSLSFIKNIAHVLTFGCMAVGYAVYYGVQAGIDDANAL